MPEYTLARCKAHIPIARCKHGVLRHVAELPGEYPEKRGGDWLVPTMIYAYIHFHSSESRQTRRNRISGWRQASLSPRRCRRRRRRNRDGGESAESRNTTGKSSVLRFYLHKMMGLTMSRSKCVGRADFPCEFHYSPAVHLPRAPAPALRFRGNNKRRRIIKPQIRMQMCVSARESPAWVFSLNVSPRGVE